MEEEEGGDGDGWVDTHHYDKGEDADDLAGAPADMDAPPPAAGT